MATAFRLVTHCIGIAAIVACSRQCVSVCNNFGTFILNPERGENIFSADIRCYFAFKLNFLVRVFIIHLCGTCINMPTPTCFVLLV